MVSYDTVRRNIQRTPLYGIAKPAYRSGLRLYLATNPSSSVSLSGVSATFRPTTIREWESVSFGVEKEATVLRDILESVSPDDVFYDVGAHIGVYSCLVGQKLSEGRVVAFEPFSPNRAQLERHVEINRIPASVQPYALSDSDGTVEFKVQYTSQSGSKQGTIDESYPDSDQTVDEIAVDTARGDDLVASGTIEPPTVIKMDIEGTAPAALDGLRACLSNDRCRRVYVEPHGNRERIRELLRGVEFEVGEISQNSPGEPILVGTAPSETPA